MIRLELHVRQTGLNPFFALLEKGVGLRSDTGCSLRDFLCGQIGLSDDYLDNRIQTLFLNARPVDDVETAVIRDGDTLALSAAMPGLVGATMRKGGHYASLRQGISQQADAGDRCQARGRVTLKMFNMVAKEVGGHLLAKGVEVNGDDLGRAARRSVERAADAIATARVDGNPVPPDAALFSSLSAQPIRLTLFPTD